MKVKNFAIILFAIIASFSFHINAERYTWSRYDLTFDTPDGGFVSFNSPTRFEIMWNEMTITIQLYNNSGIDDKAISIDLKKTAAGYNIYDGEIKKISPKGFKGFHLVGQLPDGSMANFCDLISKKSNLFVHIEVNYLKGREKYVDEFLKSFAEGKKQEIKPEKAPKQKIQKKDAEPKPIKPTFSPDELFEI